ncbi:MAG: hypothetical protein LBS79_11820, partial [Tannerella sp.]|nr:hypothetical protein [Tannerella sp.]
GAFLQGRPPFLFGNIQRQRQKSGFMYDLKRIYDANRNLVKTIKDMPGLSSNYRAEHSYLIRRHEY